MPSLSSDARFFGIDLMALWHEVRLSWQQALQKPPLAWLTPSVPVVLWHAGVETKQTVWLDDIRVSPGRRQARAAFLAVELPEEQVLRRRSQFPALAAADMAGAVELEARAHSPFPVQDLAWGYRKTGAQAGVIKVELVMASRRQTEQYLTELAPRLGDANMPEVWACSSGEGLPIVLSGYGEGKRHALMRRGRAVNCILLALAGSLLVAMAATPTLQLRQRALQAVHAYDEAVQRTAAIAKKREALMQSVEKIDALSQMLAGRIEPLRVLDRLTQVLPDDTAVQSFKLQGTKVTIVGDTSNASTLLRLLGEQAGVSEVRAPAAATRLPGGAKESYAIEFILDPQAFGVVSSPGTQPAQAALPKDAGAISPALPPAAKNGAVPVPVPAGPGASAPVATFGGRATFGGARPPRAASADQPGRGAKP